MKSLKWKRFLKDLCSKFTSELIKEAALVLGFLALMRGLWIIHPAAMWIIGGVILLWFGFPGKKVK